MTTDSPQVVVVGAGVTGLAAAHRLISRATALGQKLSLRVLESRDRPGGAIWTIRRDGCILEAGADSFITSKPGAVELAHELGLSHELLETEPKHRRSFVVRKGRLVAIPEGFVMLGPTRLLPLVMTPLLSWRAKFRAMLELVRPCRRELADESLASFARRRLGREVFERLVQPLVAGVYTADPAELSLAATLPQYMAMEREQGGLIRGARRAAALDRKNATQASGARYGLFLTLASGMDRLVDALVESLPSGTLELGSPVRRIWRPDPAGPWRLEMLDGRALEADLVLNTTEAHAAARLLDSHDSELARDLRTIPYASSAVVGLAYARDQITHPLDGFGVVVPAIEGREILAISFPSVKFAGRSPAGTVLLRVFLGGALQPDIYDRSDDVLIETAVREASSLLGIKGPPRWSELSRHPRGMPQYTLGHLDRVASILARVKLHRGLILAGNAFEGVGIPDCIRSGQAAAESAWALLTDSAQLAA